MDKNHVIALLLIAMAIALTLELMYILLRKKRKKKEAEMFRKPSQPVETMADRAHNSLLTVEGIASSLSVRGVNTAEAEDIIAQVKRHMAARDYTAAMERTEAAKMALLRLKRERDTRARERAPEARSGSADAFVAPKEPIREERSLDSLPANYLQAKFMLTATKDLLNKRSVTEGEAYEFYVGALRSFKKEDYTKALSLAIKAEKLLDSETLALIGEEKPAPGQEKAAGEEVVEVFVCPECDSEVGDEDAFCRKCGENLAMSRECPECGTDYESADMFCRKCGHRLK